MMTYLIEISSANLRRLQVKYDYVFRELDDLMMKYNVDPESDQDFSDTSSTESSNKNSLSSKAKTRFLSRIVDLQQKCELYLSQIPVVGFNSGKNDINLIKEDIMFYVASNYPEKRYSNNYKGKFLSDNTSHMNVFSTWNNNKAS